MFNNGFKTLPKKEMSLPLSLSFSLSLSISLSISLSLSLSLPLSLSQSPLKGLGCSYLLFSKPQVCCHFQFSQPFQFLKAVTIIKSRRLFKRSHVHSFVFKSQQRTAATTCTDALPQSLTLTLSLCPTFYSQA